MRSLAFTTVLLCAEVCLATTDSPPGVIGEFCSAHFPGGIAAVGEPFNATDVVDRGKPDRRIVAYLVTSSTSYVWYEHGGRGYHQHLVRFNTVSPDKVAASYVFIESPHSRIEGLLSDTEFLRAHVEPSGEL
jgi:hypothetical protein